MRNYIKLTVAFILSWLIPGIGYLVLNKKVKALLLFASVMLLVSVGIIMADFREIRFVDNPYYYVGRFGGGLIWGIIIMILHPQPSGIIPAQYFDIGHLYLCVAGTLNLVIALSVFNQRVDEVNQTSTTIPEATTTNSPQETSNGIEQSESI
jgi:hypothetical protein